MQTLTTTGHDGTRQTLLAPSRSTVLALAAYIPLAFAATLLAGDLGDVGFWFVWIPVVAIVLYLPVVGIAALIRRRAR